MTIPGHPDFFMGYVCLACGKRASEPEGLCLPFPAGRA